METFAKLKDYVADSEKLIVKAIAEFGPMERLDLPTAYVLGHLRCVEAGLRNAQDFIKQISAYKDGTSPFLRRR
jgi:hypothetical protein